MNPLTPNPFLSYASTTTTTTTTTSKPPQELDPNGKDKASDDPSGSAGQSRYSETDFRPKIDERCNPIGCRHTPQFHESLFVPVGVKSGGSFPGFIAQKKKQATDEDPDPQTLSGINHKRQWIVKPGIDHDIFELRDVSKISSIDRRKAIMGAMQECLSALLYLYLSNGQYRVPKTKLAYLPWKNPYAAQHKSYSVLQNFIAKLNKGRPPEKILTHGVHLLSKFVQGYRDLNQALVVVSGQELKFMDYVKQHRIPERIKVDVGSKYVPLYEELPLIGLLEILAVARLMHDIDVLGHGNNVGFVIEETPHGRIAKAVKIDPGLAFYLFHGEGENCINEDIVNMFLKSLGLANTNNLTQEEYPNQLDKILQPLLPIIGKFARKQFLTDLKDIQTDSHCNYIAWNQLTPKQQKTFLQALDHAINILQNHEALHYLLWRDGLLEKTFGTAVKPVDIDLMIGKLEASAQAQLTVYEQAFKTHKIDADAALLNSDPLALLQDGLRRHATNYAYITRLFPSLTAHDHRLHISESYVNLSIMRREEKEKSQESDGDKDKEKTENIALAYQDEREQHYRSLQQTKTPIEIEKLFDDPTHRRQLIIGVPGVGKSTLCQHLFYRCSQPNGLWANRFDLVFWIPLRRLKSSELESTPHNINTFLAQVAHTHSLSGAVQDRMDLQQLEQLIATRTHKTLWILDGYDEVITEASLEGSPIHRLLNHLTGNKEGPTLLITSRPQTHYTIPFDCVLENKPEQAAACIRFLKTNLTLWNVIHVPILLEIVCNIWDQDATTLLAKVNTLPKLYKMMVDHLWLRYTRKTDVPQNIGHLPKQIAKIAAKGFIDNQGALTNQWLKKLCPENLSYSDWCQQLEQTGVLRAIQSDAKYTQHEFIHLSFQEYFASQIYIKALIQGKERAIEFFDHTQYSHAHRLMWLFTFGGLYQHYQDTRDEAPLRRFWQVVFSRMDVQGTN
ncbi:MAG: NACHT domain-containing protein, partial [Parachlamydiaceae bacterium]